LNGDGKPEIIVGRHVFPGNGDSDGNGSVDGRPLWTATGASLGSNGGAGSIAPAVDLDGGGPPQGTLRKAAHPRDRRVYWPNPALSDGLTAAGQFGYGPYPQIVYVVNDEVRLLDHLGQVLWGPVTLPGTGFASQPVIADFDGDGRPEIGVGMRGMFSLV